MQRRRYVYEPSLRARESATKVRIRTIAMRSRMRAPGMVYSVDSSPRTSDFLLFMKPWSPDARLTSPLAGPKQRRHVYEPSSGTRESVTKVRIRTIIGRSRVSTSQGNGRPPRLAFRAFRVQKTRTFPRSRGFLDFGSMPHASNVVRLSRPDPQLAPASPVFLVALGLHDDRDLFFQASLKSRLERVAQEKIRPVPLRRDELHGQAAEVHSVGERFAPVVRETAEQRG